MIIENVLLYPIYDINSYSKYKLTMLKNIIDNLTLAGVENITLINKLNENENNCSYEALEENLKKYSITVVTGASLPKYMFSLNPKIVDIRTLNQTYELYKKEITEICCTDFLDGMFNLDLNLSLDEVLEESVDKESIDIDNLLNNVNNNEKLNEPITANNENNQVISTPDVGVSTKTANNALLLAMINKSKETKNTKKKSKTVSKKIPTLEEYITKEIKEYLSNVKMVVNANTKAPCLTYLNSYLPKNILKLIVDSSSCKLTLSNFKIKSSYINMKGVF